MKLPVTAGAVDPSVLPGATANAPGIARGSQILGATGWQIANQQDGPAQVPGALAIVNLLLYYVAYRLPAHALSQIGVECMTLVGAHTGLLGVWQADADGLPGALIWDSGSIAVGAAGGIVELISAGSFSLPEYDDGAGGLLGEPGELVYLGFAKSGSTPVYRGLGAGNMRATRAQAPTAAASAPQYVAFTQALGSLTPPDPATPVDSQTTIPVIWVRK